MRLGRRRAETRGSVLLVTTESLPGFEVVDVLGLVAGESPNRERALEALARTAAERGADAVLAVRIDSSASGGAFVSDRDAFAYGTAVKVRWRPPDEGAGPKPAEEPPPGFWQPPGG
jgi:uncharacterized protein YbjQ (UPF0145 family)